MDYAKKMVILSKETFDKLIEPQLQSMQTPGNETSRYDNEMAKVLNSTDSDDSTKWKMFEQLLQRYMRLNDQNKKPFVPKEVEYGLTDKMILESMPFKAHKKADQLVSKLRNTPDEKITWDKDGLVSIDGQSILKSNIIDLLHEAIDDTKVNQFRFNRSLRLPGCLEFAKVLHDVNIPSELIDNKDLWWSGSDITRDSTILNSDGQKNSEEIHDSESGLSSSKKPKIHRMSTKSKRKIINQIPPTVKVKKLNPL